MELAYRMANKSAKIRFLHWNPECSYWPEDDYEIVDAEEASKSKYEICIRCRQTAENEMKEMGGKK